MQYKEEDYNAEEHDRWKALSVVQPIADALVTAAYAKDGVTYAEKSVYIRSRNTKCRGELLICSAIGPSVEGHESGVTLGKVDLYDVKPVKEFTAEDWDAACVPEERRKEVTRGYGWIFRNPRRVIEMPVYVPRGINTLVYTKGVIIEYPRAVVLDKAAWKKMKKQIKK